MMQIVFFPYLQVEEDIELANFILFTKGVKNQWN